MAKVVFLTLIDLLETYFLRERQVKDDKLGNSCEEIKSHRTNDTLFT